MRVKLDTLLSEKHLLLADGATGTNFMEMGLEPGFPPDLWNISEPQKPTELHQMFVDAGSDIILTNTFGANAPRLKLHDAQELPSSDAHCSFNSSSRFGHWWLDVG